MRKLSFDHGILYFSWCFSYFEEEYKNKKRFSNVLCWRLSIVSCPQLLVKLFSFVDSACRYGCLFLSSILLCCIVIDIVLFIYHKSILKLIVMSLVIIFNLTLFYCYLFLLPCKLLIRLIRHTPLYTFVFCLTYSQCLPL